MAYETWSQANFSKGELSPYMYARAEVQQYYDGLKTAQNVLTYPTGAAGKRFGTLYQNQLNSAITSYDQIYFQTFQYLDQCIYQLVFRPLAIDIYLEGILIAVVTTALDAQSVYNLTTTVIGSTFRVSGEGFRPLDLVRTPNGPVTISSISANQFVVTTGGPFIMNAPFPIKFVTTGTLPVTTPQVKAGIVYFARSDPTGMLISIHSSAYNAKFNIAPYTLSTIGTGTNYVMDQNIWTFSSTVFKNLPVYDFNGGYDAFTFTPSATVGAAITLTSSGAIFTPDHVGGAFIGAGGTSRIIGFTDSTHVTISVQTPFDSTAAIQGSLSLLAEPAWSDARGWPQVCSSYQNRALFANTDSLPNGFYASVVNDYSDFGDLTTDDDDAISWYPSSNDVNVIRFIVPFRSITVHTNSGIYSSPLSEIAAITPKTFTLQLQDSTPADVLQPQAIDNQIIVLSGNDVHTMLWDGINNAYTSNIVSVVNEQVIRDPVDETSFADLRRAGSRYVFIINFSGSMAVYQTLQSESVSGFTPQILEQSNGAAYFLQVASSSDGRCWFVTQREIASGLSPINITGFTADTLTAVGSNFSTTIPTAVAIGLSGTPPISTPPINTAHYYWAIGVTADTFKVYFSKADALANLNHLIFSNAGVSTIVVPYPLVTRFFLEELTQDVHLDCAVEYNGAPTSTVNTGDLFNTQSVKMIGDGFGFNAVGTGDTVSFQSHGSAVEVSQAYIGFPIRYVVEPMPISQPAGANTTLTKPTHIRFARFMFNNTVGGTINGVPIEIGRAHV